MKLSNLYFVLFFSALLSASTVFAEGEISVVGQSSLFVGTQDRCDWKALGPIMARDSQWQCELYAGAKTIAIRIDVLKQWEDFQEYCDQKGQCGHRRECIANWSALCERD